MATKTENQKRTCVRNLSLGVVAQMSGRLKQLRRQTTDIEITLRIDRALATLWSLEHSIRESNYSAWKSYE
jgi:hypothetical protein